MLWRAATTRAIAIAAAFVCVAMSTDAVATIIYRDIQIAGNLETQNLVRFGNEFDIEPVQQRNTFRIQYEHKLVKRGKILDREWNLPFIRDIDFFAYYRGVYDSIYDIAPGGFLHAQDGSRAGRIETIRGSDRTDIAWENVLREIFVDVKTTGPVSFRIGRQQIIWGTALNFRALDQNNALDLTWHFQQEAGLLGRVGFSELRTPNWAVKALWNLGSIGPLTDAYFEVYDMPFGFAPTKIRLLPAPWSVPLRNPLRGGLVVDAGEALGLPVPGLLLQPCFDPTGSTASNAAAHPDFSQTRFTGTCPAAGIEETSFNHGHYDRWDPKDVNQFGARFDALTPQSVEFSLNYIYRRAPGLGLPGSASNKTQFGTLAGANALNMVQIEPHSTTDPLTGVTTDVLGYARVPIEFYFPYIHILGVSMNYPEEWSGSVLNLEATYMMDVPVGNANPLGNGVEKKNLVVGAFNIDRPTWIRFLNPRSTFTAVAQLNVVWNTQYEAFRTDANGDPLGGDVGTPNAKLIPGLYGDLNRVDKQNEVELLSLLILTTFYRGGSVVPLFGWISDWGNAPSMEFLFLVDWYLTNNFFIEPGIRLFTNFGRNVDDPFGIGRLSEWDEFQLKATWQF